MSIIGTIKEVFDETTTKSDAGSGKPVGAYWCYDCEQRILETEVDGDEAPPCPDCGEEMTFERSAGTADCAC